MNQIRIQLHDSNSCDFGGHAIKDWGEGAPTPAPTDPAPTNPPGTHGTCKGNPNASNSSLCGGMDWVCGPSQNYVNIKV